jgi:phenylalanyl-tRNA synthetase beta chain
MDEVINGFSLVSCVKLFDVYTGKQVAKGKKSLAYRLTFQSPDHTLADKDADKIQQQILEKLSSKLGATLRS